MKKYTAFSASLMSVMIAAGSLPCAAQDAPSIKKTQSQLTTNMVDQAVYYEATSMLRFDRLYRKLFNKKLRAEDINIYDEVPDSAFFENRHARSPLSTDALERGYLENEGPSADGEITVMKGKSEGLHPGFFIKDARGDFYLLKFDDLLNFELNTSAEIIASRFYHAIGYNVPQYTVFSFSPDQMVPAPEARMIDRNGFKQPLTQEMLDQYVMHLPHDDQGRLRASASKILKGENKGPFSFQGRRKNDPEDTIDHERRRSIRALRVFASWLNNNDVRHANTLDMWVTEEGRSFMKHYLIDFNAALGGAAGGAKPPMFNHEYFLDYGAIAKNYAALGFRKSDWQKRLEEQGPVETKPAAVGYFDNNRFSPKDFKVQLPYYAFKDLTRADGFWAAKIIASFTDEDIKAMIRAGKLTNAEDAETIFQILSERRDIIARYWFSQASPLDQFSFKNSRLIFSDLEISRGYAPAEGTVYTAEGFAGSAKKGSRLGSVESPSQELAIPEEWKNADTLTVFIRVKRADEKEARPYVLVEIKDGKITRLLHQD